MQGTLPARAVNRSPSVPDRTHFAGRGDRAPARRDMPPCRGWSSGTGPAPHARRPAGPSTIPRAVIINLIGGRPPRGAMRESIVCRVCGRGFAPYGNRITSYCKRCRARADREISRVLRVRCKECRKAFSTPNRAVRYCSDECRKAAHMRQSRASRRRRPAERNAAVKCRTCGKKFTPVRKPGKPLVYCSEECRTEGRRRLAREAMRRYVADPRKRAMMAARTRVVAARHKARRSEEGKRQPAPARTRA